MNITRAFRALGPVDLRSVRRDAMLKWMVFLPLLVVVALRIVLPLVTEQLRLQLNFDLRPYYSLVNSFMFLLMPIIVGMVIGFLLLDQRDDHTLSALQVTPLSLNGYLLYRISLPMLLALLITLLMVPCLGLYPVSWEVLLFSALSSAPLAPVFALFYASFAQNKVQGFAVMKAPSIFIIPPLAANFIQSGWQWAFGMIPTYWPVKVYWLFEAGSRVAWPAFITGLLYQMVLIMFLLRWFNRVMHAGRA